MKLTYIKEDNIIGINGIFHHIDNIIFDPEISAIQWYETYGEIEYFNKNEKTNKTFTDETYISSLIDLWNIKEYEISNNRELYAKNLNFSSLEKTSEKNFIEKNQDKINNI